MNGDELTDSIIPMAFAPEEEGPRLLALALGWPFVPPGELFISCRTLGSVGAELCCRYRCAPWILSARRLVLLVDDPQSAAVLLAAPEILGSSARDILQFALTTSAALDRAIHKRLTAVRGAGER